MYYFYNVTLSVYTLQSTSSDAMRSDYAVDLHASGDGGCDGWVMEEVGAKCSV